MKQYQPRVNFNMLRLQSRKMDTKERQELYLAYKTEIAYTLYDLDIIELSKMIVKETDLGLREYECDSLSKKLQNYIGPIDLETLEELLALFPIKAIWRLATEAEFDLIRGKAETILSKRIAPYDNQIIEKRK